MLDIKEKVKMENTRKAPSSLVCFDFNISVQTDKKEEEWLTITRVNNIGRIDKPIEQKMIRLSPEQQRELYFMLHEKFGGAR